MVPEFVRVAPELLVMVPPFPIFPELLSIPELEMVPVLLMVPELVIVPELERIPVFLMVPKFETETPELIVSV